MIDTNLANRIAFYQLDRHQASAFKGVRRALGKHIDKALERFYAHVSKVPALGTFFASQSHIDHAKSAQRNHWLSVFSQGVDEEYAQRATKIGQVHARIGLEPRWYIGGYSAILEDMIHGMVAPGLMRLMPGRRALARQITALGKVALLDMDLGLSAYFHDSEEKMRGVMRDQLGGALSQLATGNLAQRLEGLPPEYATIQRDYNTAIDAMRQAISTVVDGVEAMANGSNEIRAASDDLSRRTEQQAAALERTASSINEITSKVRDTAATTGTARQAIANAHDEAERGRAVVTNAVAAMGQIEESSSQISQIITLIDGISFQTNLLALNAGVEAARAGEAGKGFAVVASEVRALAQRSADAANDIKKLITSSTKQVDLGVKLVNQTGDMLSIISDRVSGVRDAIEEIAETAAQQAASIGEINQAVEETDKMTQQNAAMSEECTAAAASLAHQASELTRAVQCFSLRGGTQSGEGFRLELAA